MTAPWHLPILPLTPQQRAFLSSFYGPPIDVDLDTLPEEVRTRCISRIRESTALADVRLRLWTAEQVRKIIEAVPTRFQVLFTTVALMGLRLGELLALQWKHVDFENCRLRIQQSLWNGKIVPVKTRSSVRVILFGDVLARHLTDHLQRSVHIGPDDFVFARDSGDR